MNTTKYRTGNTICILDRHVILTQKLKELVCGGGWGSGAGTSFQIIQTFPLSKNTSISDTMPSAHSLSWSC